MNKIYSDTPLGDSTVRAVGPNHASCLPTSSTCQVDSVRKVWIHQATHTESLLHSYMDHIGYPDTQGRLTLL